MVGGKKSVCKIFYFKNLEQLRTFIDSLKKKNNFAIPSEFKLQANVKSFFISLLFPFQNGLIMTVCNKTQQPL